MNTTHVTSNIAIVTTLAIALVSLSSHGAGGKPIDDPIDDTGFSSAEVQKVVQTYVQIAEAAYHDAWQGAQVLNKRVDELVANPNPKTLETARRAWLDARVPYMQTEAYRFTNEWVDEWEGKVNAWPLDEGLIDYVEVNFYPSEETLKSALDGQRDCQFLLDDQRSSCRCLGYRREFADPVFA